MPQTPSPSPKSVPFFGPRQKIHDLILALSILAPLEMGTVDCNNAKPKIEPSRNSQLEQVANKTRYEIAAKGFVENQWGAEKKVLCQEIPENAVGLARQVLAEKDEGGVLQDLSSMEKGVVCTIGNPEQDSSVMLGLDPDAKIMVAKK
jgi:hypothetical protein